MPKVEYSNRQKVFHICFAAFAVSVAMFAASAQAQIRVDVRNAETGGRIEAIVKSRLAGTEEELGRVSTSEALEKEVDCDGRQISVKPVVDFMYEKRSPEWISCETEMTLTFRPVRFASNGFEIPNESGSIPFFQAFASSSSTSADYLYFRVSLEQGDTRAVSIASKAIAESLQFEGREESAEIFWAISAQAAVSAMAEQEGILEPRSWLNPAATKFAITDAGRDIIRNWQLKQDLPPVGVIGERSFAVLETASSSIAE